LERLELGVPVRPGREVVPLDAGTPLHLRDHAHRLRVRHPARHLRLAFEAVEGAALAKLAGLAVVAGNTIAAESQEMIIAADRAGLFIQGLPA